jgi:hypothetical protein
MPIHIRRGGGTTWILTNKVYLWRGGRWLRVYGAYIWSTQYGETRWWPMFLFEQLPPPPAALYGVSGNHTSAYFTWAPTTDETVLGHRVCMRRGARTWGEPDEVWPPENSPMYPVGTHGHNWQNLVPDNHYTFTVKSYDEFGRWGPESPPRYYWTGHPQVDRTNPSYPGFDWFHLRPTAVPEPWVPPGADRWGGSWGVGAPYGTRTWRNGVNKWVANNNVDQGIPKTAPAATGSIGCIAYHNAYEQVCGWFGWTPPRSAIVVNRDAGVTKIIRVQRLKVVENGGTKRVTVQPGWTDFHGHPATVKWNWEATTFQSPKPGEAKAVFLNDDPHRLAAWVLDWIQLYTGTNALVVQDNDGARDSDGVNYVSFARGDPYGSSNGDWNIECQVRFTYPDPPYDPPRFW